jgi:hypothetical protein
MAPGQGQVFLTHAVVQLKRTINPRLPHYYHPCNCNTRSQKLVGMRFSHNLLYVTKVDSMRRLSTSTVLCCCCVTQKPEGLLALVRERFGGCLYCGKKVDGAHREVDTSIIHHQAPAKLHPAAGWLLVMRQRGKDLEPPPPPPS